MTTSELDHWLARSRLRNAGLTTEQTDVALDALRPMLVSTQYVVPTFSDLMRAYSLLAEARLTNRISLRWVMCLEIHDKLAMQYERTRYISSAPLPSLDPQLADDADWVFKNRLYWNDRSQLFGMPIRIDPAARRVMFEIDPD